MQRHKMKKTKPIHVPSVRLVRRAGQPLDNVLAPGDLHDGHAGDLAQAPLEVLVVGADDVDARLGDAVEDAVVGVDALVLALEDLEVLALGYAEGEPVLGPELLQLWGRVLVGGLEGRQGPGGGMAGGWRTSEDTGGDEHVDLGVEAVHAGLHQGELPLDGVSARG